MRALASLLLLLAVSTRVVADDAEGVFPTASYESGFGFTGGGRLLEHDMLGVGERLELRAGFGGRFRQAYGVHADSGRWLSLVTLRLDASYEQRPNEYFFGIGDTSSDEMRFREDAFHTALTVDVPLTRELGEHLKTRIATSYEDRRVMGTRFGTLRLDAALLVDTRLRAPTGLVTSGWFVRFGAANSSDLDVDRYSFTTYGGELQIYADLFRGREILALRALAETIEQGTPRFVDLPELGGTDLLRGYPRGRFRDRARTIASLELTTVISERFAVSGFVDVGRVWPSLGEVTLEGPRIGYGLAARIHVANGYELRLQTAVSRDGDFALDAVLSP